MMTLVLLKHLGGNELKKGSAHMCVPGHDAHPLATPRTQHTAPWDRMEGHQKEGDMWARIVTCRE